MSVIQCFPDALNHIFIELLFITTQVPDAIQIHPARFLAVLPILEKQRFGCQFILANGVLVGGNGAESLLAFLKLNR